MGEGSLQAMLSAFTYSSMPLIKQHAPCSQHFNGVNAVSLTNTALEETCSCLCKLPKLISERSTPLLKLSM